MFDELNFNGASAELLPATLPVASLPARDAHVASRVAELRRLSDELDAALLRLPVLYPALRALVDYARSQFPGLRFLRRRNGRFVADPQNFIALDICGTRVQSVTVNLRGRTLEFPELPELPLRSSLAAYSSFRLTRTDQLAAALLYVRRAADIYRCGRGRVLARQRLLDLGCAE